MTHFLCPTCARRFRAPNAIAGRSYTCRCGHAGTIPAFHEVKEVVVKTICQAMAVNTEPALRRAIEAAKLIGVANDTDRVDEHLLCRVLDANSCP